MMRAFEQAWSVLKALPEQQGGRSRRGKTPQQTIPRMLGPAVERRRRGNLPDFSQIADANRAEQMANIQSIKDPAQRARIMQQIEGIDPNIGVDSGPLPVNVQNTAQPDQGYPDIFQNINPLRGATMSQEVGRTVRPHGRGMVHYNEDVPITEIESNMANMTPGERARLPQGLAEARKRTESDVNLSGEGFTPYRKLQGIVSGRSGVPTGTRLTTSTKPPEARPMRTGKPTVDQNLADMLEQMAADNPNAKFDRPPEVDEKPEPMSGGFNEQIDTAGRGGRRFNRTQQSIAGQDDRPNLQAVSDAMDPEAMSQARLMELAAQLGKKNGASQTAVDQTA